MPIFASFQFIVSIHIGSEDQLHVHFRHVGWLGAFFPFSRICWWKTYHEKLEVGEGMLLGSVAAGYVLLYL